MDLLTFLGVTAQMLTSHGYVFLRTTFFADVMVEGNCSNWATCLQLFASVRLLEGKALEQMELYCRRKMASVKTCMWEIHENSKACSDQ